MVRLEVQTKATTTSYTKISIPVWYDWKTISPKGFAPVVAISIPVWYDWKHFCFLLTFTVFDISIPVWYDWKGKKFSV